MEMTLEQMAERLKHVEAGCICKGCPTYRALGTEDDYMAYCFSTRGRSKKITEEKGCICASCPIFSEMKYTKDHFCTRGTQKEQMA